MSGRTLSPLLWGRVRRCVRPPQVTERLVPGYRALCTKAKLRCCFPAASRGSFPCMVLLPGAIASQAALRRVLALGPRRGAAQCRLKTLRLDKPLAGRRSWEESPRCSGRNTKPEGACLRNKGGSIGRLAGSIFAGQNPARGARGVCSIQWRLFRKHAPGRPRKRRARARSEAASHNPRHTRTRRRKTPCKEYSGRNAVGC